MAAESEPVKHRILVVDDEPENLEFARRVLRRKYEVIVATGADEGIELLKQERFAAVLSDQRMPGMKGTDFLARARELVPTTVRMILTGFAAEEDSVDAINVAHVSAFLTKPIHHEVLMKAVDEAVDAFELNEKNRKLAEELERSRRELDEARRMLTMGVDERTRAIIEQNEWLDEASIRDKDTGLYNQKYFMDRLHEELARSDRYGSRVALVVAQIDGYTEFANDYGATAADKLFFGVVGLLAGKQAQTSAARLRPMDVVARYRTDYLAMILPSTPREGAVVVCKRVRSSLADAAPEAAKRLPEGRLTMCFGIAEGPADGKTSQDLLIAAETALRRAREGRNRITVFG